MSTGVDVSKVGVGVRTARAQAQVIGGRGFDWAMIGVCTWLIVGIYSDAWAHNHLRLDNFFLSFMQDHYLLILVATVTGLIADVLLRQLKPSIERPTELRFFAFVVPVVLYLLYFLTLTFTTGVNWTIHLWLGSTVVSGIAGFLLSYLLVPPQIPVEQEG